MDISKSVKADVYHDLDKGIPFPDNTFDWIYASHVLEHTSNPTVTMEEIWRVLKSGGVFEFKLPFATYIGYHMPHRSYFTPKSFDFMIKGSKRNTSNGFETKAVFDKKFMKVRLMLFHVWLPEVFQYLHIFMNVLNSFKGELVAVK